MKYDPDMFDNNSRICSELQKSLTESSKHNELISAIRSLANQPELKKIVDSIYETSASADRKADRANKIAIVAIIVSVASLAVGILTYLSTIL